MTASLNARAALVSVLLLALMLGIWHLATMGRAPVPAASAVALTPEQIEYAKLMGKDPAAGAGGAAAAPAKSGFPTLGQMAEVIVRHAASPFYDNGPTTRASRCSSPTRWAAWHWATCAPRSWPCRWAS